MVAVQRHLEAVAEVDVQNLAREAMQHQVGGVAVAQPEHVPHLARVRVGVRVGVRLRVRVRVRVRGQG